MGKFSTCKACCLCGLLKTQGKIIIQALSALINHEQITYAYIEKNGVFNLLIINVSVRLTSLNDFSTLFNFKTFMSMTASHWVELFTKNLFSPCDAQQPTFFGPFEVR